MLDRMCVGFGGLALRDLLASSALADERPASSASDPITRPLAERRPMFPARAKRVIFLFMHGGPSHVDLFDPKPKLKEYDGAAAAI